MACVWVRVRVRVRVCACVRECVSVCLCLQSGGRRVWRIPVLLSVEVDTKMRRRHGGKSVDDARSDTAHGRSTTALYDKGMYISERQSTQFLPPVLGPQARIALAPNVGQVVLVSNTESFPDFARSSNR